MGSAIRHALALCVVAALSGAALADDSALDAVLAGDTAERLAASAVEAPASDQTTQISIASNGVSETIDDGASSLDDPSADDPAAYQTLSTLAALGLGVLGLLWVRRHTAEL